MNFIKNMQGIASNTALISALFSWFIAQFLKIIIDIVKRNKIKTKDFIFRALLGTGGMPSSHSATITSVTISIGIASGYASPVFALSFVLMIIIIRDASGVRLSSGKQAQILNELQELMYKKYDINYKKIKVVKGHTALECFVGAIVGALVAFGMNYIQ